MIDLDHLPYRLIRRYSMLEFADACQLARMAIWQARQDFDPSRGQWDTFAYSRVRTALWTVARKAPTDPLRSATTIDTDLPQLEAPADPTPLIEVTQLLTDDELQLLRWRAAGWTFARIGRELGISRETVRKRVRAILACLEEYV